MKINAIIYNEIKCNNNMITTARVEELGFSRALLTEYVKQGLLERTPFIHTVRIPSNAVLSNSLKSERICYYIKPELHDVGMILKKNTLGNQVRCYNVERTICDIMQSRNRVDEETVISTIKNYAAYEQKDLNRLAVYAKQFRVSEKLKRYLEVLL